MNRANEYLIIIWKIIKLFIYNYKNDSNRK